jgi:uncharacterized membrane protein
MVRFAVALIAAVCVMLWLSPASGAVAGGALKVQVYSDGYSLVTQQVAASASAASVEVPLLSDVVSNLVAADQNGSPLSYRFSGGNNLTVYTLGATLVTVTYDTNSLTSKNGTVWTLEFTNLYNATVVLPQYSTLSDISGTPYSINVTDRSPEAFVGPGTWKISYGVAIAGITTVNSTSVGPVPSVGGTSLEVLEAVVAGVAVVAGAGGGLMLWRRRRGLVGPGSGLRPDDVQVLNFIQERGGRVLEPEIRTRFALPKTSAWRQIKRLERLGFVKVTKIGSQNQIELLRNREPGD